MLTDEKPKPTKIFYVWAWGRELCEAGGTCYPTWEAVIVRNTYRRYGVLVSQPELCIYKNPFGKPMFCIPIWFWRKETADVK